MQFQTTQMALDGQMTGALSCDCYKSPLPRHPGRPFVTHGRFHLKDLTDHTNKLQVHELQVSRCHGIAQPQCTGVGHPSLTGLCSTCLSVKASHGGTGNEPTATAVQTCPCKEAAVSGLRCCGGCDCGVASGQALQLHKLLTMRRHMGVGYGYGGCLCCRRHRTD